MNPLVILLRGLGFLVGNGELRLMLAIWDRV